MRLEAGGLIWFGCMDGKKRKAEVGRAGRQSQGLTGYEGGRRRKGKGQHLHLTREHSELMWDGVSVRVPRSGWSTEPCALSLEMGDAVRLLEMQIMGELANHQASTPPPFPTPTRPASSLDQPERGPHELRPGNAVQNPQRPAGSGLPWAGRASREVDSDWVLPRFLHGWPRCFAVSARSFRLMLAPLSSPPAQTWRPVGLPGTAPLENPEETAGGCYERGGNLFLIVHFVPLEANITQLDLGKPGLEWQMHLQSPPVFPLCPERKGRETRRLKGKCRDSERTGTQRATETQRREQPESLQRTREEGDRIPERTETPGWGRNRHRVRGKERAGPRGDRETENMSGGKDEKTAGTEGLDTSVTDAGPAPKQKHPSPPTQHTRARPHAHTQEAQSRRTAGSLLSERPAPAACACKSSASGGAQGRPAAARAPEKPHRPPAPGSAATGGRSDTCKPGAGERSDYRLSGPPVRRPACPPCGPTGRPVLVARSLSPCFSLSLCGCLRPGRRQYLKTPAGVRATPEAQQQQQQQPHPGAPGYLAGLHHLWRDREELTEARILAQNPGPHHPTTLRSPFDGTEAGSPLISPPQPPQRTMTQTRGPGAPGAASGNEEPGVGAPRPPWRPPTNWDQELRPEENREGERQTDRERDKNRNQRKDHQSRSQRHRTETGEATEEGLMGRSRDTKRKINPGRERSRNSEGIGERGKRRHNVRVVGGVEAGIFPREEENRARISGSRGKSMEVGGYQRPGFLDLGVGEGRAGSPGFSGKIAWLGHPSTDDPAPKLPGSPGRGQVHHLCPWDPTPCFPSQSHSTAFADLCTQLCSPVFILDPIGAVTLSHLGVCWPHPHLTTDLDVSALDQLLRPWDPSSILNKQRPESPLDHNPGVSLLPQFQAFSTPPPSDPGVQAPSPQTRERDPVSPQRSKSFEVEVKEVWGLGKVSLFPNFPETPSGKQVRKLRLPRSPAPQSPLATAAAAPQPLGSCFSSFPWRLARPGSYPRTSGRGLWRGRGLRRRLLLPGCFGF
ncbi:hypothetical protein Cadr_000012021 [Camelus dromedarius]|uniref:Uncharacterized protein n=1 Tax=Camelus dromedarius TaxID=9838 RepID=A0A5N4DS35_CAMDR|nr:hypothetical protein Cadr_000012021 [Camelus dromedarius]